MKRRQFIKGVGMSSAAVAGSPLLGHAAPDELKELPPFKYGSIHQLEDCLSQEGYVVLRLVRGEHPGFTGPGLEKKLRVTKAGLARSRTHFFNASQQEVLVIWLDAATPDTRIRLAGSKDMDFRLGELVEKKEISGQWEGSPLTANFLLDRELGELSLEELGIRDPGTSFSFVTMADPQGGRPDDAEMLKTRMKIHNAYIEESVDLVNKLDFDPLFTLVAGDVCDDWGYEKDLAQMNAFLSRLNGPVLYGIGNHETLLRSSFGPGYNMDAFSNFLAAQKAMNGLDKLLYSFHAGLWHFIVWPDPLRPGFWESHPHYFDWLERDLEKNRHRPTMVFQHVPSQPIGITPHINYAESVYVRRTFLDILSKHGNVKYILSGHVHIPVRASFKTALQYRGMKMINIPAAGYRPRSFGEEDFYGGPSQGVALVHIQGEEARIQYKTLTEEIFDYPDQLPDFDQESYALWLKHKWELPAGPAFMNPRFEKGLQDWTRRYVYPEDVHPSNLCETRDAPDLQGKALYLYCRRRAYQAPGQDRLPQDINRVAQAVGLERGIRPGLSFRYRIDESCSRPGAYSGAFFLVEGYRGSKRLHKLMYSAGKIWVNNWGARNRDPFVPYYHFALDPEAGSWKEVRLNLAADFERSESGKSYVDLQLDRLVLSMGVWNINDGEAYPFGIYITDLELQKQAVAFSLCGGNPIEEKPVKDIWWRNKLWPNVNIAGEHRYIIATRPEGSL